MPTAGAGGNVETGWRVKVAESMADTAAPAVGHQRFVRPWLSVCSAVVMLLDAANGMERVKMCKPRIGLSEPRLVR